MHMADVENPNPGGGGTDLAVAAEPDNISKIWQPCEALFNCLIIVVSVTLLVLLFSSGSPDIFWLVVGVLGLVYGACSCAFSIDNTCIRGNTQGIDQSQIWRCVCT
ncbi:hypothetical protein ZWY2020_026395 [Hordeum vulgare]|nr:hypothetical protein ZWY2020_026395 [Hordeum vulgare]